AEEIGKLQIYLLGILRAIQRRLHVGAATHQIAEKLLASGLNVSDPHVGQSTFGGRKLLSDIRDEGLPAIEFSKASTFRGERRKSALVFVHGVAELLGLSKSTGDGDQRWRQAGLQRRDLSADDC